MKTLELKLKKDVLIVDENDFGYYTNIDNEYLKALRKACDEYIQIMKIKRMENNNYNKEFENILLKKGS